ncbi:MAG TPA: hypothetical protein VMV14_04105 [Acidimicrobiales bacterium]|nr:hypothetical protein [Acidimicrobiales bacterium]
MPVAIPDRADAEWQFVSEVARGLAALGDASPGVEAAEDLTVPLGLSAWIVRASIGLPDAYDALLRLRGGLLRVSGLDLRTEPVPLKVADDQASLRNLGHYLFALMGRASRYESVPAAQLADEVLALLEDEDVRARPASSGGVARRPGQ